MDSLTQIVLGAAVGEVCLGRKLGNKAMVWGAIAGTIPDLDVLSSFFLQQIDSLAFHRGISHSIFFAFTFSFFIAYFAKIFYEKGWNDNSYLKTIGSVIATFGCLLLLFIFSLVGYTAGNWIGLLIMAFPSLIFAYYFIRRSWTSKNKNLDLDLNISYAQWYNFFFWSVFTHPILDCFTVYGTQLFQPFSDYRVAFNNISVADPIYTFLFGICLMVASFYHRLDNSRRRWNYVGILLSCLYMSWTFVNKNKVNNVMEYTLARDSIEYSRYMTSPTILNNILWSGTADSDTSFWIGQYSFFDKQKAFKLNEIPKNYHLLKAEHKEEKTLRILKWFSNDYCAVLALEDGNIQLNDLRYGQFDLKRGNVPSNYIFRFPIVETPNGYILIGGEGGPTPQEREAMFPKLWNRIKGE